MLDTDQLRSFIAIVDTGSFTRAAERVNKTQSAVSMHVKRLEERLGKPLFIKHGRGVRLSRSGEHLIEYARTILQAEAAAFEAITRKGLTGQVRFGVPDDYAAALLADIMTCFSLHHPLVEVLVVCLGSMELAERVRKGDLDLAIVTASDEIPEAEIIKEEPLYWVAGQNKLIEYERPLPLALGDRQCNWTRVAIDKLNEANIPMKYSLVSSNYAAIAPIVEAGLAVTVLPESIIRRSQRVIPKGQPLPELPCCKIGLMQASSSQFAETETLANLIRETIAGRADQATWAGAATRVAADN